MILQMALGAVMIVLTTVRQSVFMLGGVATLRAHVDKANAASHIHATLVLAVFVLWLFLATIFEVTAWAILYRLLAALPSYEEALYFSTVTFATLGYGDIILPEEWRLLSSFEAVNGLIMFGWSTALVVVAVQWTFGLRNQPVRG